ncbi:MAG TPA: 2-(1,2-epoxy-1,2-dihydrophenyl)acetyl-CoA isomerase [Microscillaceae bacterium]|nr:2-(1,2-epoxy-1,2-dihydrophenyl)acetyl-CoA isomerase [Microscillaceae bacterium]
MATDYECILYQVENGTCTITLNRPKVYNALNNQIAKELVQALTEAEQDKEVRVIVLTGQGKGFCTGHDLKAPENMQGRSSSEVINQNYKPIIEKLRHLAKPIICRLNGVAAGAGCSLALACDMIIASEEASLIQIFVNIGLVMDAGASYFLTQMLPRNIAFELATKGKPLTAKEAERWGVVNKTVPADQLDEAVAAELEYFAKAPTKAIGMMKRMLEQAYNSNLADMIETEANYQDLAQKSKDHTEGAMAFLQKRKPEFKGK